MKNQKHKKLPDIKEETGMCLPCLHPKVLMNIYPRFQIILYSFYRPFPIKTVSLYQFNYKVDINPYFNSYNYWSFLHNILGF